MLSFVEPIKDFYTESQMSPAEQPIQKQKWLELPLVIQGLRLSHSSVGPGLIPWLGS